VYDSCSNTLFIGKKIVYLPSCHSTNDIAAELVRDHSFSEGVVVITDEQTAGRGQRGTQWVTSQGLNFTFSLILKPVFLNVSDQFMLSQVIALGVRDYLLMTVSDVGIKWPNDLYIHDCKVGGILIENALQGGRITHSVIGIGLNMNQLEFPFARATSVRVASGHYISLATHLPLLLECIERRYLRLRRNEFDTIQQSYQKALLGFEKKRHYNTKEGLIEGYIAGVTKAGRLRLRRTDNDHEQEFDIKEIEWTWDD
jgi:BirA family transcriptional regulator, biotin operon repressor / biotin---[acetyl-CoA-carboxylase] ligase